MSSGRPWTSSGMSAATRSSEDLSSTTDLDTGLRRASISRARVRLSRSLTEEHLTVPSYSTTFPNASSTEIMSLPMYDEITELPLPKARFKVAPRDEEGQESLPSYNSSVQREWLFDRKMEMTNPYDKATDRSWQKAYVVLNNTVLSIYKPKKALFGAGKVFDGDKPVGYTAGHLVKSYTLQHAEVGAATDYKKRHYAIRIRAETQQFLLACNSVDVFLDWLEALSCGVDLALPLEERALPQYQTIPRRRRRRRAQEIVQQQEEIIRTHFPHLLRNDDEVALVIGLSPESNSRRRQNSSSTSLVRSRNNSSAESLSQRNHLESVVESANVPDLEEITPVPTISINSDSEPSASESMFSALVSATSRSSSTLAVPRRPTIGRSISAPVTMRDVSNRSSDASSQNSNEQACQAEVNGKWRGTSNVSREAHLRFARRCMAVLTADAPRQSEFVMHQGMRYKLIPEAKGMLPDSNIVLPTYESHKSFGSPRLR